MYVIHVYTYVQYKWEININMQLYRYLIIMCTNVLCVLKLLLYYYNCNKLLINN